MRVRDRVHSRGGGRAIHVIVLSTDAAVRRALRTMRVGGNRRAQPLKALAPVRMQAVARPIRAVIALPAAFADRPDRTTLPLSTVQAEEGQKAGDAGTARIRIRTRARWIVSSE